jgi:hypothetical protein
VKDRFIGICIVIAALLIALAIVSVNRYEIRLDGAVWRFDRLTGSLEKYRFAGTGAGEGEWQAIE